jgi:hypothetical protein
MQRSDADEATLILPPCRTCHVVAPKTQLHPRRHSKLFYTPAHSISPQPPAEQSSVINTPPKNASPHRVFKGAIPSRTVHQKRRTRHQTSDSGENAGAGGRTGFQFRRGGCRDLASTSRICANGIKL